MGHMKAILLLQAWLLQLQCIQMSSKSIVSSLGSVNAGDDDSEALSSEEDSSVNELGGQDAPVEGGGTSISLIPFHLVLYGIASYNAASTGNGAAIKL